jgi:hypothetical protein
VHRMNVVGAAVVGALALALGAGVGPAAGDPAEAEAAAPAPTVTGWVVENPRADGLYDTFQGSATIGGAAGGTTITCPLTDGWGRAESGTVRPQDWFASSGVTTYGGCTGSGVAGLEIVSSPEMIFAPDAYDSAADRIIGSAYPGVWSLFLDAPDCQVDLYAVDSDAPTPLTYDNRTGTLDVDPIPVVATRAEGPGCAGLAQVGDVLTFEPTVVATPVFTVRPA